MLPIMASDGLIASWSERRERKSKLRVCAVFIAIALLVRVAIAAVSIGTNDARLFWTFASEIREFGLISVYGLDGLFNHPPLVGLWINCAAMIARRIPDLFGAYHTFTFIFKLPIIAADGLAAFLIWKIWRPRIGDSRAAAIAAAAAWSLCGIVVSAFHCNTDPIYAALCLTCVYLLEERGAFFLGGIALAAAINIKIIPVLLIPGLLLSCTDRRQARLFLAGLAPGVVPFLPALWQDAPSFVHNVLGYNSSVNNWGIDLVLLAGKLIHGQIDATTPLVEAYHQWGRYLVFALVPAWSLYSRATNRWTRYEVAAMTFGIFLVFTPGFGIQYVVMIAPMLFAIRPRFAFLYSIASGAFATALYLTHLQSGAIPFQSELRRYPLPESMLGLITWGMLVSFMTFTLIRSRRVTTRTCRYTQSENDPRRDVRYAVGAGVA